MQIFIQSPYMQNFKHLLRPLKFTFLQGIITLRSCEPNVLIQIQWKLASNATLAFGISNKTKLFIICIFKFNFLTLTKEYQCLQIVCRIKIVFVMCVCVMENKGIGREWTASLDFCMTVRVSDETSDSLRDSVSLKF